MGVKKAVIVAGGRGERLRPLTDTLPKPMIEVGGKPVLLHVIEHLKKYGITDVILSLWYLPAIITRYFGDGRKFGVHIDYIYEKEDTPMGTAGAIVSVKKNVRDTFIVTYADILRDLNIPDMIAKHKKNNSLATLHVYKRFGPDPKSKIVFNAKNRIMKFIERPIETDDFVWSNGSFYIFEPEIFICIPNDRPSDFGHDIFPNLLRANKFLLAYPSDRYFIDIGNIKNINLAQQHFSRG